MMRSVLSLILPRRTAQRARRHNELERWRREIDGADRRILDALEMRARTVRKIGRYKRDHGLPILDAARERLILSRVLDHDGVLPEQVRGEIFGTIIQRMREWESTLD